MRTINYKGFELDVEAYNNALEIHKVEASITNQIALLTSALIEDNDIVKPYTIELDYKYWENGSYVDLVIDTREWDSSSYFVKQKVLIELLMLEENEIMEQIGEVV